MSLSELLRTKSSEYEVLAEWHGERASLDDDHLVACQAMLAVGIALREVAEALDAEWGRETRTETVTCPIDAGSVAAPSRAVLDSASACAWQAVRATRR
jgi:hypothetical protein